MASSERQHAATAEKSISEAIAAFAVDTRGEALPESATQVLAMSLLDWSAVAIAGACEPVSRIVSQMLEAEGGRAEATVVGSAGRIPARGAAMANGTTSHALDYDDTHFDYTGHPSAAVVPAALAVAERIGARGSEFADAALIGVEAACRVGAWLGATHYQRGFHQTGTAGSFGAAAAAARLLGLDRDRTRHALGIVATRASGLKSQFGTMGKPLHAGLAAANGVEAATLAAAGFISRPDALECEQGFADTHAGEYRDLATVLDGLGTRFRFEAVQHKFHACCHATHAALEALTALRDLDTFAPADIDRVTIIVHPKWLRVCNLAQPRTALEAKFSYRLSAAMVLAHRDTAALTSFSDEACTDPELAALRDRIQVETDASLGDTAARVRVAGRDGHVLEHAHDLEQTLPVSARDARVRSKAAALLGSHRAERLRAAIASLGEIRAADFAALLQAR